MAPTTSKPDVGCNKKRSTAAMTLRPRRRSCRQCQIFKGMNGSLPRTRMSRNSTDSPLITPKANDLGYTKDPVYGELTCAAPGCGYPGPTGYQCYSKKMMLAHIAKHHGTNNNAEEDNIGGDNGGDNSGNPMGDDSGAAGGTAAAENPSTPPPPPSEGAGCSSKSPSPQPPPLDLQVPDVSLDTNVSPDTSIDTEAETECEEEPKLPCEPTFRFGVRWCREE